MTRSVYVTEGRAKEEKRGKRGQGGGTRGKTMEETCRGLPLFLFSPSSSHSHSHSQITFGAIRRFVIIEGANFFSNFTSFMLGSGL